MNMPALSTQQIRSTPQKTSVDEDTDSESRETTWSPSFFAILKCLCLSKYFPIFFEQINPNSQDFQEFKLTVLTHVLVNI